MINFGKPIRGGWRCMKERLFAPFDFGKWLSLGFTAFLASLLHGSSSFNSGNHSSDAKNFPSIRHANLGHWLEQWQSWFWIAAIIFLMVIALAGLFLWLGSRGQFMFLDNVVHNRALVRDPWNRFREPANQLFRFYLVVALLTLALLLVEVAVIAGLIWPDLQSGHLREYTAYLPALILGLIFGLGWVGTAIFFFLFLELGIPLIYHQGCRPLVAAGKLLELLKTRSGDLIGYCLVRLAMGILLVIVYILVTLFTCCVGGILLALPYVASVLTLPISVFRIGFTLDCLAQFGPEYDLWSRVRPPELPEPLPQS